MLYTRHRLKVDNYVYDETCQIIIAVTFFSSLNLEKNNYACDIVLSSSYGMFYMIVIHKYVPHLR